MTAPLLQVENLSVAFGQVRAVDGVSFALQPCARLAIVGESGSGKTSVALAIADLLPRQGLQRGGAVTWPALGSTVRAGRDVGVVFQDPMSSLNPVLTVGEQVAEVAFIHLGLSWDAATARAGELLERVGLPRPRDMLDAFPHQLSGGQRQRVALAMAIAARPKLLIADEPTTALDTLTQAQIVALLDRLARDSGLALILITHDLALARGMVETGMVMNAGRVVETGPIATLLSSPRHAYTRLLLDATLDPDTPGKIRQSPNASPLLRLSGLRKSFGSGTRRVTAVDGIDLTVMKGETLALVGGSGSGKTTLARLILRLIEPDAGKIEFAGLDLLTHHGEALRRTRARFQMVFQDPLSALNPLATVRRLLTNPLRIHGLVTPTDWDMEITKLLARVGLSPDLADRHPHEVSGGQRQRINIARALASRPELLVLDEPVSSLDVSVRAQILKLLDDIQRALGLSYLFITHDMSVVRAIADRVAVMENGRIVELGAVETIFSQPAHPLTRALIDAAPRLHRKAS
jgi:peptide/nickel transport system ATP-binding protein